MQRTFIIHPVILCGGSGTRLWPVSRQSYPKQFSRLMGDESLFQATARRLSGKAFAPPVIVTSADFRFIVRDQLAAVGITPAAILIEPEPRNTAPAVLAATLWLAESDPGGCMLVAPSDHLMPDAAPSVRPCCRPCRARRSRARHLRHHAGAAETGYGYLELAAPRARAAAPRRSARFVEKPGPAAAVAMTRSGGHLWNAGIFLFRADVMAAAFAALAPDIVHPVRAPLQAPSDLSFLRLEPASWAAAPSISIDYAIMEKAPELWVMPYAGGWSDLGGWAAIWAGKPARRQWRRQQGDVTAFGCRNSLLRAEEEGTALVGIGLDDIVAVAMPDAVLVARKSEAQRVKEAVEVLKARQARQATAFRRDHRPWGWFESLAMGKRFQVKRIVVHPGAALSLQSHHHRAEHWIVVEGTARVTIGEKVQLVSENQSVYIPLGEKHRLENPGRLPMVLIEVQTGAYLGEDDITRYEDIYARS